MFRNLLLINALLLVVVCLLGAELYGTLNRRLVVPQEARGTAEKKGQGDDVTTPRPPGQQSFDIIASANLFNPSRASKKEEAKVSAAPMPRNQPKLFGTIISGDKKMAILEDPSTRERKTFGLNESVGGFLVSDIQENKVVLSWSGEEVTVQLREDKGVKPLPKREVPQRAVQRGTAPRAPRDQNAAQRRRRRPRRTRTNVTPTPPAPVPEPVPEPELNQE